VIFILISHGKGVKVADKKEKKPKKSNFKKKLDISAVGIVDNIVYSKTDAWAYYKLTNRAFDFLTAEGQASLMQRITLAFNNIANDRNDSIELHLICTSVPVDIDSWAQQIEMISEDWNRAPGYSQYMNSVVRFLKDESYTQKMIYLGVHLGKRGALDMDNLNIFNAGWEAALETAKEWFNRVLDTPDEEITESEEKEFRRKSDDYFRSLSGGILAAKKATAEELLLLIKRQLYPWMPAPYLEVEHGERIGPGDIAIETGSVIEKNYRYLKINQMIGEHEAVGYRATLSMTKFPRIMDYPGRIPYFYMIQKMGLPFTTFARMELHPAKKMQAELEKKKKEQRDELENLAGGMDSLDSQISGIPANVREALEDSQMLGDMLNEDKSAWVEGSYFIVVETPTLEHLKTFITDIKDQYTEWDININWTAGDQVPLFLSQMPGDKRRMTSFDQTTNLAMIAASGFNFSSDVGDPLMSQEKEHN